MSLFEQGAGDITHDPADWEQCETDLQHSARNPRKSRRLAPHEPVIDTRLGGGYIARVTYDDYLSRNE
ncbi:hypothetical protein GCM10009717_32390 [Agromyces allii]|uniref:Uncharacterized protein n=1 Tax=Agromyces allii TaxID=393607 RepID=A0ABN2R469_9MICO